MITIYFLIVYQHIVILASHNLLSTISTITDIPTITTNTITTITITITITITTITILVLITNYSILLIKMIVIDTCTC